MRASLESNSESLLMAARAGVGGSLSRLLEDYSHYLRLLAASQLDPRLQARVSPSDVVQETLFEAHRDFPGFAGRTVPEFRGWLRKILIHNVARMVEHHLIAEKRDARREVSLHEFADGSDRSTANLMALLDDKRTSPSGHAQRQESSRALAEALAELPADYREVILLRHVEGLPFKVIAVRLGRTHGATRMLWLRAIELLRRGFAERGLL
jgi:RNA polymerase sigma-70 factor, ECF subfamily